MNSIDVQSDPGEEKLPDRMMDSIIARNEPAGPKVDRSKVYRQLRELFEPLCRSLSVGIRKTAQHEIHKYAHNIDENLCRIPYRFIEHCSSALWGLALRDGKGDDVFSQIKEDSITITRLIERLKSPTNTFEDRHQIAEEAKTLKVWESETYLHTRAYHYSVSVTFTEEGKKDFAALLKDEHALLERLEWISKDLEAVFQHFPTLQNPDNHQGFGTWIGVTNSARPSLRRQFGEHLGIQEEVFWKPREMMSFGFDTAGTVNVAVGEYGERHAKLLFTTTHVLLDILHERYVEDSRAIYHANPDLISSIARALPMQFRSQIEYAPLQAMSEGVLSIQHAFQLLSAERIPDYETGSQLIEAVKDNVNKLARTLRLGVLGPLAQNAAYLKNILDPNTLELSKWYLDDSEEKRQKWISESLGKHETMTGYGCPVSTATNGSLSGIEQLTEAYLHIYSALETGPTLQ